VKRREFIAGMGSAAATWPVGTLAQQPNRVPRVGVSATVGTRGPIPKKPIRSDHMELNPRAQHREVALNGDRRELRLS
jgi:hypothetical protein